MEIDWENIVDKYIVIFLGIDSGKSHFIPHFLYQLILIPVQVKMWNNMWYWKVSMKVFNVAFHCMLQKGKTQEVVVLDDDTVTDSNARYVVSPAILSNE